MKITDRISILEYCQKTFPGGVGVEIGVAGGHFTKQIMATWSSLDRLYIVDAWQYFETGYNDPCNLSDAEQEERYQQVKKDFSAEPRVMIIRALSSNAAKMFTRSSVDFIYLDANHSELETGRDLEAWYPMLRSGGIIAGHDYEPGNGIGYGVKAAVDKFAAQRGLPVYVTNTDRCRPSGVYGACWEGHSFVLRKE